MRESTNVSENGTWVVQLVPDRWRKYRLQVRWTDSTKFRILRDEKDYDRATMNEVDLGGHFDVETMNDVVSLDRPF